MQQMQAEQSSCLQRQAMHNNTATHTCMQKTARTNNIHSFLSPLSSTDTHTHIHIEGAHTHTLTGIPIGAAACTWKITVLLTRQHQLSAWGQRDRGCRERERHGGMQTKQPRFINKNNILNSLIRKSFRDSTSLTDKCRNSLLDMHERDLLTTETN